jgi:hypothetical protein
MGIWFHASPHERSAGTVLTPGGGESPRAGCSYSNQPDFVDRNASYVWVSPSLRDAREWRAVMGEDYAGDDYHPAHIYEVKPHDTPEYWGEDEGHSTNGATVVRKVFD